MVFGAAAPKKIAAPEVRAAIVRGLRAGPNSSAKHSKGHGTRKRHLARQDLVQFNAHSPMDFEKDNALKNIGLDRAQIRNWTGGMCKEIPFCEVRRIKRK